ncbi:type II secretion system minor pseudopilin GspK [Dokdonella fugitiva]|uniref:type II secretion system minor pseudopilin GspK n=1 Tax=Dokdonella fugitiva TaxID=328517 RepID=UPI0015FA67AB|nr:type II secretion system minor pseudopilin GspK [Dokdonella fugitiva]MBA8884261.1 general secretion pathway protein K [Dokdonella fugitiva]
MIARSRQRGVALLVALLVVAIAVILVAALLDRGELALARTRNSLREQQAEAYSLGLETYAAQVLIAASNEVDSNASPWAMPLPPQDVPGGVIRATMRDLDGCFNLNNLAPPALGGNPALWAPTFGGLLAALALDPGIAAAVQGWLDPEQAEVAESARYLAQSVPYRAHGGVFAHVSELRLVRGVDAGAYAKLAPHVCALPPGTAINVNTASAPVLQALLQDATPAVAQSLWQDGRALNQTVSQFTGQLAPLGVSLRSPAPPIDVHSRYFLARGDIVLDGVPYTFFSVIERGQGRGVRVLARSRGADDALVAAAPVRAEADIGGDAGTPPR